jgi:hypothetical protein
VVLYLAYEVQEEGLALGEHPLDLLIRVFAFGQVANHAEAIAAE